MKQFSSLSFLSLLALFSLTGAFSTISKTHSETRISLTTKLSAQGSSESMTTTSRRNFVFATATALVPAAGMMLMSPSAALAAAGETKVLLEQLELSRQKIDAIPSLLQKEEWEAVRQILKTPPVNFLWNMGDSKNPVLQLAKATDEFELIDLKDELSLSLQICDQLTYDNVFVYYQPGNGKVKVKEPTELAVKAMKQLDEAIQVAKASL